MPVSSLPADQIAVLELVLERGRSYDEIADLLGIDAHAVRARAHAAIDALGPNGSGRRLTTARRAELADYLLGQQDEEAAEATRAHLEGSSGSRAWARVVAGELKPLGGDKLPEIPKEGKSSDAPTKAAKAPRPKRAAAKPAAAAAKDEDDDLDDDEDDEGAPPSSTRPSLGAAASSNRLGGALLIAGVLLIVVVAVVLLTRDGDDDKGDSGTVAKNTPTTTTPQAAPQVIGQINLTGEGRAVGIAQVVQQANTKALVIAGQNLPEDKDTAYAVWLYNSGKDTTRLGYAQPSQQAGRLEAIAPLPKDSSKYKELVISAESRATATKADGGPKTPTAIVLRGELDKVTPVPANQGGTGGAGTTTPGATPTTPGG